MNVFAGYAVVIFCLLAAGAIAVTPIWVFSALAGLSLAVAGAAYTIAKK